MRNYKQRIPLGLGKWAFEQDDLCAANAKTKIQEIRKLWRAPAHFFHLQKGGHIAAAKLHVGSTSFAKIDLRRFFEQVTRNRIIKRLTALGISYGDAENFAILSTVRHTIDRRRFVLPYGFVQSPLLASIDLDRSALGQQIRRLKSEGIRVSVYVDDILVSSTERRLTETAHERLWNAAGEAGYVINTEKSQNPSPALCAFNLLIDTDGMTVQDQRYQLFAQQIAMLGDCAETIAIAAYVESVNPGQVDQLFSDFPIKLRSAASVIEKQRIRAAGV